MQDEGFDEDYVQYALVDPTCEKTIERFPLGCEQRRCSKTLNANEKVCAAKSGTACSAEECQDKCKAHMAFTCTTYSLDPSNGDCYVWESCVEEGPEPDYNTYVLVEPTCGSSQQDSGCPARLCSSENAHRMVCSGTTEGQTACDVNLCPAKCAGQSGCAFFAHDPTDQECLLFESCDDEAFSDDFTLFRMPFEERKMGSFGPAAASCSLTQAEGGCPLRRCAKSANTYNKICNADDVPCTLDECESHCRLHTDFACTHFSHDAAESECYIWESCDDEGPESDYTNYMLGHCHDSNGDACTPSSRRLLFGALACVCA